MPYHVTPLVIRIEQNTIFLLWIIYNFLALFLKNECRRKQKLIQTIKTKNFSPHTIFFTIVLKVYKIMIVRTLYSPNDKKNLYNFPVYLRTNQNFNNKHFHKYFIYNIFIYKVCCPSHHAYTTLYNNNKVVLIYSKVKQYVFNKTYIQNC